ncbi:MAG TPA: 1-acyl-sn-glycerol-3-phosphate acyltransferase [Candidatus Dormibacteraeota bacterium]|nr:1-acyl-sn-glycerol-3-phosphate acyltransferase [Candidatus Dormibacteraeota bacterium]
MSATTTRTVVSELMGDAHLQEELSRLSVRLGRSEEAVAAEATGCFEEMVATHGAVATGAWRGFGRLLLRAYTVETERAGLDRVRALGRGRPLIFLPSHRSYLDPVVMRTVFARNGLPPAQVLGGINAAFWPVGPVARRSGHVFIRRTTRDSPVYRLSLRAYVAHLLRTGQPLEWYIEGGRTRTGKLRPPRFGLLAYVMEAIGQGAADPVIVPVSLVYENLPEMAAMAAEDQGQPRSGDSLAWLVGYARAQGRTRSTVHVRFGEPLEVREWVRTTPAAGDRPVEKVAFEVCHRINRATPVTPTSLVTLALLGLEDRALTLAEVGCILVPLLDYLRRRDLPSTGGDLLERPEGVRATLDALTAQGVVSCFAGGAEPVWMIAPSRHLEAAFHRNSAAHLLVNRAIAELISVHATQTLMADPLGGAWRDAIALRELLKFEFFFAGRREFDRELREEMALFDPHWEERAADPDAVWARLSSSRLFLAHRLLRCYIEAQQVVADRLVAHGVDAPVDERALVDECLGAARQYRLQQRIGSTEAISRELLGTALRLARHRSLTEPGTEALALRRREFAGEVAAVARRLTILRDLALTDLDSARTGQEVPR